MLTMEANEKHPLLGNYMALYGRAFQPVVLALLHWSSRECLYQKPAAAEPPHDATRAAHDRLLLREVLSVGEVDYGP